MSKVFLSVAVDVPVERVFDYFSPFYIFPGSRVRVDFSNKRVTAIVVGKGHSNLAKKRIIKVLDDGGRWFSEVDVRFLKKASDIAWVSWGEMCFSALPYVLRGAGVWSDFLCEEVRPLSCERQEGRIYEIKSDVIGFEEDCFKRIKERRNGVVFWIVGSKRRAEELIDIARNKYGVLAFYYWQGIDKDALRDVIKGVNKSDKELVLIAGTRHLGLFPLIYEEDIFVENAWLDIYRQEVTPKYDLVSLLKERVAFSKGRVYFHKICRNERSQIFFLDAKEHRILPAFVEEEFRRQVKSGISCAVFTIGYGYARMMKCPLCRRIFVCDRCNMPYVLIKEKGKDYLHCGGCGKRICWDGRCVYCGSLSVKLGRFSSDRWISLVKKRLSDCPIYELQETDKIDDKNVGIYICKKGQIGIRAKFGCILLLGVDSVIGIGRFYAPEIARGIIYSISYKTKRLFVRSRFLQLLEDRSRDEDIRRKFYFPPYGVLIQIEVKSFREDKAINLSTKIYNKLQEILKENIKFGYFISNPYRPIFFKKRDKFYYNVDVFLEKSLVYETEILSLLKEFILSYRSKRECIVTVEMFE